MVGAEGECADQADGPALAGYLAGAGRTFSGTWQADLAGFTGKTFEDMLKRTVEQQVSGSWRSGRAQGNWWLQGSKW